MKRKFSFIYTAVGAAFLFLSCQEKPTLPALKTIPVEEYQQTLDAKEIFRRSDFYNISSWVVPDGNGDLKIQLGKETVGRNLWMRAEPFPFSMTGGAEKTVRIDIPPIGESESIEVPFSFEVPWYLSTESVPETYRRLLEIELCQSGHFSYHFGDDVPFISIVPDIRLFLPSWISPDPDDHNVLPEQNGYRFYTRYYGPLSDPVSMIASIEVPEEYQTAPEHTIRMESDLTVNGTLRLDKKQLKKGAEWPDHLDLSITFTHDGPLTRAVGLLNLPSEYTLPDISFHYDLQIRPFLFQAGSPIIHLYDTRLRLDFLNKCPFNVKLHGTVASYKNGQILQSAPFGDDTPINAILFDAFQARWSLDSFFQKTVVLSEFDRFPVTFSGGDFPDYQEHVSLQSDGLSRLLVGDPDDIRFTDLRVERDPDEIVDIAVYDFEEAYFNLSGQITTPLRAAKDFSAQTQFPVYFPRDIFEEDTPVHKAILEGTMTSTLPFNIELTDLIGSPDISFTWNKFKLSPSLAKEASSAHFTLQLESLQDLKELWIEANLRLRLTADESCAGKPINESDGIFLTDVVVKY